MKYIKVNFGGYYKEYVFKTNLNLIPGTAYYLEAEGIEYHSPATIEFCSKDEVSEGIYIKEITSADIVSGRPRNPFEQVYYNKEKGTVIIDWYDGTKTSVKQHKLDKVFDLEKALYGAYLKRAMLNRECFNDFVDEAIANAIDASKK